MRQTVIIKKLYIDDYADFGGYGAVIPFKNRKTNIFIPLKKYIDSFNNTVETIEKLEQWQKEASQSMADNVYITDIFLEAKEDYEFLADRIKEEKQYIYDNLWEKFRTIFVKSYHMGYHGTSKEAYKYSKKCEQYEI